MTGPYAHPLPACPGTPRNGYDQYEGDLTGDEADFASDQEVVYSGVVRRVTDVGVCDLLPENADGVANYCNTQLVGGGEFKATLRVYADRTEVYFQTEPVPGKVHATASGDCEAELAADVRRMYLEEGEGVEHWIGPKQYGPGDRVGGPPKAGTYPEPRPWEEGASGRWTLVLGPSDLRAEAGGPYRIVRGGKVRLDGTRSTGDIRSYTWTLAADPCPGYSNLLGGDAPSPRTKEGAVLELVALCPFAAKLVVSDGSGTDEDYTQVEVVPRDWKTKKGKPVKGVYTGNYLLWPCTFCQWGKNLCAREYPGMQEDVGHQIHHPIGSTTWEGAEGYVLQPVHDPGMLFDGWWYVADQKLEMTRAELVHFDLSAQGCIAQVNRSVNDFGTLRAAVAEHEHQHTLDLEKLLGEVDPAREIEAFVAPSGKRDKLREAADRCIALADGKLGERVPRDDAVHDALAAMGYEKPGKILLPKSAPASPAAADCAAVSYESYDIPSYAGMGDASSSPP
jgi:hypothetical protein